MKKRILITTLIIIVLAIVATSLFFLLGPKEESTDVVRTVDLVGQSEKVIGDPENASVIVYEYADYGCSHCAEWNNVMNELYEKYDGKLVIVFRGYNLGFKNGLAAARAATAADFQGYWKEYKDLLFKNQAEWLNADAGAVENIFVEYFNTASNGQGDADKFKSDMYSEEASARLAYEQEMGDKIKLSGTPTFRIGGETVEPKDVAATVERLIDK